MLQDIGDDVIGESATSNRTFLAMALNFEGVPPVDFKLDLAGSSNRSARWMTVGDKCTSSMESSSLSY